MMSAHLPEIQKTNFTKKGLTAGWLQVKSNDKDLEYLQLISVNDKNMGETGFSQKKTQNYITSEYIGLFKDPPYEEEEEEGIGVGKGKMINVIDEGWDYDLNKPFFELDGFPNYRMYPVNDGGEFVLYEAHTGPYAQSEF